MKTLGGEANAQPKDNTMLTAIIVTATIVGTLGYALGIGRRDSSILRRPYNNRYNAASGAREESFS